LPGDSIGRHLDGEREERVASESFGAPRQDRHGFRSSVLGENVDRGGADISLGFDIKKIA
jgi:hypothetical protein